MVIGIVLVGLSIPSALAERRSLRVAAIIIVIGGFLMALAFSQKPGGYSFDDAANAFFPGCCALFPMNQGLPDRWARHIRSFSRCGVGQSGMPSRALTTRTTGDGNAQDEDKIKRQEAL